MSFIRQQAALGLGHAVWCARNIVRDEPFAVLLPDVLIQSETSCLAQMVMAYNHVGGNIIAVEEVPRSEVSNYGIIKPASNNQVETENLIKMDGMVEKPSQDQAPSNLKITGRYILQPEILKILENQTSGAGGEVQLTDAMARLMKLQDFHAFAYEGEDYDCGSILGYFKAVLACAKSHEVIGEEVRSLLN